MTNSMINKGPETWQDMTEDEQDGYEANGATYEDDDWRDDYEDDWDNLY